MPTCCHAGLRPAASTGPGCTAPRHIQAGNPPLFHHALPNFACPPAAVLGCVLQPGRPRPQIAYRGLKCPPSFKPLPAAVLGRVLQPVQDQAAQGPEGGITKAKTKTRPCSATPQAHLLPCWAASCSQCRTRLRRAPKAISPRPRPRQGPVLPHHRLTCCRAGPRPAAS